MFVFVFISHAKAYDPFKLLKSLYSTVECIPGWLAICEEEEVHHVLRARSRIILLDRPATWVHAKMMYDNFQKIKLKIVFSKQFGFLAIPLIRKFIFLKIYYELS